MSDSTTSPKPINPDRGGRGGFFPAVNYRHRSPEQLQSAHDHIRYLQHIMTEQLPDQPEPAPAPICASQEDHEFDEDTPWLHTMQCVKCGMMVEHPARFIAQYGVSANDSTPEASE